MPDVTGKLSSRQEGSAVEAYAALLDVADERFRTGEVEGAA